MTQSLSSGVASRIARYRKVNGWSARVLSEQTQGVCSRETIANLESGRRRNLTLEQFLAISLALRIPPVALLVDLDRPADPTDLHFGGTVARPLDGRVSNATFARWLLGRYGIPVTAAAVRVAELTHAIDVLVALTDNAEVDEARSRLREAAEQQAPSIRPSLTATTERKP